MAPAGAALVAAVVTCRGGPSAIGTFPHHPRRSCTDGGIVSARVPPACITRSLPNSRRGWQPEQHGPVECTCSMLRTKACWQWTDSARCRLHPAAAPPGDTGRSVRVHGLQSPLCTPPVAVRPQWPCSTPAPPPSEPPCCCGVAPQSRLEAGWPGAQGPCPTGAHRGGGGVTTVRQ